MRVLQPHDGLVELQVLSHTLAHQACGRLVESTKSLHAQAAISSYRGTTSGTASGSVPRGSARNRDLSLPVRLLDVRSGQWRTAGSLQAAAM